MKIFEKAADLVRLKRAYRAVFSTPEGKRVLADLARLCHAASTTSDPDAREHSRKEGKRQVWLRIQNMLHLPDDEVFNLEKEKS